MMRDPVREEPGEATPEPAVAGSYGESPGGHRLPGRTRLGPVRLRVSDLERSLAFYQQVLGLLPCEQEAGHAVLCAHGDGRVLVELDARPGTVAAPPVPRLGLFHFAILLPDRAALGGLIRHLAGLRLPFNAADHLVSEAVYLEDPDGLGIEVYADRPRSAWLRIGRELLLSTEALDLDDLVRAAGEQPWQGMPAGTAIGHLHLRVSDLAEAARFFSDALGFERMTWSYPGALFMGAGGYHHHVATNTWGGAHARRAAENESRLLEWTIELPDPAAAIEVARRLVENGYAADHGSDGDLTTRDPWGTAIRIRRGPPAQSR